LERFADEVDLAQHCAQQLTELAIAAIRHRAEAGAGREDCLDCGETIPKDRLAQVPNACRCTPCQDRHERQVSKAVHG
jgi:phage/conjugal plasmid C-4 type zinc finger TraR family protein